MQLLIRDAVENDAAAIAAIYGHHVLNGTASYDLDAPPVDFHRDKIRRIRAQEWPFLVAVLDGSVAGYAYLTQFRDRAAYRFTAEDSIYVDERQTGLGIGKALLTQLVERAEAQGFRTIIAVIGGAEPRSMALHARLGFEEVGRLAGAGFKFGRWLDSVYMQLRLRNFEGPVRPGT